MGLEGERLQFQGRLCEKKLEAEKAKIKIKGLVDSMRTLLNPFVDVDDLDTELIVEYALDLAQLKIMYVTVRQEIEAIKKALGKG